LNLINETKMFGKKKEEKLKKLLLCGLDYTGKTTLVKQFKGGILEDSAEFMMSTPFINLEKITLPYSQDTCLVYDMSGQVSPKSTKSNNLLLTCHALFAGSVQRKLEFLLPGC